MYVRGGGAAAVGGTASLAATGSNIVWLLLAGFALLGAGMALLRIVPRRQA